MVCKAQYIVNKSQNVNNKNINTVLAESQARGEKKMHVLRWNLKTSVVKYDIIWSGKL